MRRLLRAWDAAGRDVTTRVARRDEVYADGWERGRYQGVAAEPWTFTFDLDRGEIVSPGGLHDDQSTVSIAARATQAQVEHTRGILVFGRSRAQRGIRVRDRRTP